MSEEDRFWFGNAKYKILEGKEGVREAYDSMAEVYDVSKSLYWTRKMEEAEERIVREWLNVFSGTFLDVGCGTGRYALKMAREGVEVVALDLSANMLYRLKSKAKKDGAYGKINVVIGGGEHLPFRKDTFQNLVCALAFDHLENCSRAAREFSRVLRLGGMGMVSVFNGRMLTEFQRRYGFGDKVPFKTEEMGPVLVFEVGHSAEEIADIFSEYNISLEEVKGCCYWHISPLFEAFCPFWLDSFFNLLKGMLKYAEVHVVLMKKKW